MGRDEKYCSLDHKVWLAWKKPYNTPKCAMVYINFSLADLKGIVCLWAKSSHSYSFCILAMS